MTSQPDLASQTLYVGDGVKAYLRRWREPDGQIMERLVVDVYRAEIEQDDSPVAQALGGVLADLSDLITRLTEARVAVLRHLSDQIGGKTLDTASGDEPTV